MTRSVIGIVMAGGLGTRMRSHDPRPKPLVEVGGISLLEHALRRFVAHGVLDIRIALRHDAATIRSFVEMIAPRIDAERLEVLVEDEPAGTIGALYELRHERATFVVANGDLLSAVDVREMLARHHETATHVTIATHDEHHRLKLGEVVTAADGSVVDYLEKPIKSWRISSGTYVLEPEAVDLISAPGWLSFPTLVRRALDARLRVREYHHDRPWIDVNDARDVSEAEALMARDPIAFGFSPRSDARS